MNRKLLYPLESLLALLCLTSFWGGLVYFFYSLNSIGCLISLILAIISFIIIQYFFYYANKGKSLCEKTASQNIGADQKIGIANILLFAGYIFLTIFYFFILISHRTSDSIISPWQALPKYFFIIYFLASLFLIGNIVKNKKIALGLIGLHYFLSFSAALIIYQLGYGYDSFVHQATENLIDKNGAVLPKPFYYLGQYSLIVILHKITNLSIIWLDRILVPLISAIFLPIALWQSLNSWFDDQRLNLLAIFSLLGLTYPWLIVTTPQNLSYLLLIIVILLGLNCRNYFNLFTILLLSLTALIIQPIAGIPAVLFTCLLAIYHSEKKKKWLYSIIIAALIFILPSAFYLLNKKAASGTSGNLPATGMDLGGIAFPGQENFILNFIYLYGFNLKFAIAALIIGGLIIVWKNREHCRIFFLYLAVSMSLFLSYIITTKISFAFLINYERGDYPARIMLIAAMFLLPFIIISIYSLLEKIIKQNTFIKLSWTVFITLLVSASFYLTYPRNDNYFNSHGYSVSRSDIESVDWINNNSAKDYIVLSNQQVGAAALSRFGFKKYYQNDKIFYYPIPTSSPLYQYYLDMVYKKPSRETMIAAMNLTGVDEGYFVLNKYWWAFSKILAEAKLSANSWQEINNGDVYVFKYIK